MKAPVKKPTNGPLRVPASCPHADECAAPRMHTEVMAALDQLGNSVGMVLEELSHIRERVTVNEQREAQWLTELGTVTRSVAKASAEQIRAELPAIVKAELGLLGVKSA